MENDTKTLDTAHWFAWKYKMDPDDCSQVALLAAWEFGKRWDEAELNSPERRCSRSTYVSRNVFQTLFEGYRVSAKRAKKKQIMTIGDREQTFRENVPQRPTGFVERLLTELGEDGRAICRILFEGVTDDVGKKSARAFKRLGLETANIPDVWFLEDMLVGMGWTYDRIDSAFHELKEAVA